MRIVMAVSLISLAFSCGKPSKSVEKRDSSEKKSSKSVELSDSELKQIFVTEKRCEDLPDLSGYPKVNKKIAERIVGCRVKGYLTPPLQPNNQFDLIGATQVISKHIRGKAERRFKAAACRELANAGLGMVPILGNAIDIVNLTIDVVSVARPTNDFSCYCAGEFNVMEQIVSETTPVACRRSSDSSGSSTSINVGTAGSQVEGCYIDVVAQTNPKCSWKKKEGDFIAAFSSEMYCKEVSERYCPGPKTDGKVCLGCRYHAVTFANKWIYKWSETRQEMCQHTCENAPDIVIPNSSYGNAALAECEATLELAANRNEAVAAIVLSSDSELPQHCQLQEIPPIGGDL